MGKACIESRRGFIVFTQAEQGRAGMKSLTRGTCLPPGHDFSGVEHCHLCSGVYRKKNGEGTGALQ